MIGRGLQWQRQPWSALADGTSGWKESMAASWVDVRHPTTHEMLCKVNPEAGEVAVKRGRWLYVAGVGGSGGGGLKD